jgi:hypothetical protein
VNTFAAEYLHIRHFVRAFFHDDGRESASGENEAEKANNEEFKTHSLVGLKDNRVVILPNPSRQQFL